MAQWVKNLPVIQEMQETWVQSLGQEDPLKEGMATHSSILAWRITWTEKPGGLQSTGSQRVRHSWSNWACTHACHTNGPLTQGQSESIGQQLVKWPPMKNPCQSSIVVIGLVNWILTSAFLVWEILREKQSMFNRKRVKGNLRRESEN